MPSTDQLLDAAEARIRDGGFHAVSFRDLADDLGIKSASVHYHFRRKEDLGVAVVERYAARALASLEAAAPTTSGEALAALTGVYRAALSEAGRPCLCGVMGAEAPGLPEPVAVAVRAFLAANVDWLAGQFMAAGIEDAPARAQLAVASLQGAMMLAVNLGDRSVFEAVAAHLPGGVFG